MSCYDWERGEIALPTNQVAAVKKAVRDEWNACVAEIHAACKEFWTDYAKRTRSEERYNQALEQWREARWKQGDTNRFGYSTTRQDVRREFVTEAADQVLSQMKWNGKFRQATVEDLKLSGYAKVHNRIDQFPIEEAFISFEGRVVTYSSGNNNHQVERARSYPVVQALFGALAKVKWTRGSGGVLFGNDEYNEDSGREYAGGGGSYITTRFGPLGDHIAAGPLGRGHR